MPIPGPVAERWRRYETDAFDESAEPIAFDFYWRSLEQAAITLGAGHGELLGRLESAAQLGAAADESSPLRHIGKVASSEASPRG